MDPPTNLLLLSLARYKCPRPQSSVFRQPSYHLHRSYISLPVPHICIRFRNLIPLPAHLTLAVKTPKTALPLSHSPSRAIGSVQRLPHSLSIIAILSYFLGFNPGVLLAARLMLTLDPSSL